MFLSGCYEETGLRKAQELGAYFETLVHHHIRILTRLMTPAGRLYFWRTQSGQEVDFVLEHGRRLLAIEVKRTADPGYDDIAGLRAFLAENPQATGGLLLHTGHEIRRLDHGCWLTCSHKRRKGSAASANVSRITVGEAEKAGVPAPEAER